MTIKAEVRCECAYDGECRIYRLSVDIPTFTAPSPEHIEAVSKMLISTLTEEANSEWGSEDEDDDAEQWKKDGGSKPPL